MNRTTPILGKVNGHITRVVGKTIDVEFINKTKMQFDENDILDHSVLKAGDRITCILTEINGIRQFKLQSLVVSSYKYERMALKELMEV